MFFERKTTEENHAMFDQQRIGANIMRARKAKGYTQMTLADALGVSFQAVSNWERGQTCPDIANLSQLSQVLDISIDELLGNKRAAEITKEIAEYKTPVLEQEELVQVAPLLSEEQADRAAKESDLDFDALKALAPYLSEDIMGEAVTTIYRQTGNLTAAIDLLCYVNEDALLPLAHEIAKRDALKGLKALSPYLDWNDMTDLLIDFSSKGNTDGLADLFIYLDSDLAGIIAKNLYKSQGLKAIIPIACYLEDNILNEIAREALKTGKLQDLKSFASYLDGDSGDV